MGTTVEHITLLRSVIFSRLRRAINILPLRGCDPSRTSLLHLTERTAVSNPQTFQIQEISAHPGPVPGQGTQRAEEVCKYIDVTTCIGCKACEVACVEWNDHPFRE